MSKAPTHAVFYLSDSVDFAGVLEGVYLFDSEEAAECWMEAMIRTHQAGDFHDAENREDVILGFQESLGIFEYFHCSELRSNHPATSHKHPCFEAGHTYNLEPFDRYGCCERCGDEVLL
jgi:hypothetical protein